MHSFQIPEAWGNAYRDWLDSHQALLEARDWGRAFKGYPWVAGPLPTITPMKQPLNQARVALISSAGVSAAGQVPFDADDPLGDATFRVIRGSLEAWRVDHGHYDTAAARQDYNTVFPLRVLEQLDNRGVVGSVSPENYTFMGYQPDPRPFYRATAPAILQGLQTNHVDAVLLVPG